MRAASRAVVGAGGALRVLDCRTPLTLRRVRSDDPATCALCLVGTAAGPLPGDELALSLVVEDDARAQLHATGASIAQGRSGGERIARLDVVANLGTDASLDADPGPLIVCDGSRVDVTLRLVLAPGASIRWFETVVLGRGCDVGTGGATVRWDVTRDGRPVLRQALDLADPVLRAWPGHVGGCRVLASVLISGPGVDARTVVLPELDGVRIAAAQRIDPNTVLITALADDVHLAVKARDRLVASTSVAERVHTAAAR